MDDGPTQPSTQQTLDPRRVGRDHSGLNQNDVADVLAILHPASPAAIKIVECAAEKSRQHVLLRDSYDSFDADIEEQETIIIDRPDLRSNAPSSRVGADLALRMSSDLITPSLGFVFGRNPVNSDIVLVQDSAKRISNQHFRIFLNEDAILMVEDMSTNGTSVDGVYLKGKNPRFEKRRMLSSGSIICVPTLHPDQMIKFIVRIHSLVSHVDRFQENLQVFMSQCATNENQRKAVQHMSKRQFGGPTMKWDGGAHYNIIGQVGKGAFATVHQLATKMEGKLLAAKELEKRRFMKNGTLDRKVDNEMKIMQDLRHPHVVEFVEYQDQGDYLYIIMEFVRHGDLQGYLNQHGNLDESQAKIVAQQTLSALDYLHQKKITHRDIKPDNILIADLDPLTIKLSDFGLSKRVKQDETFLKTFCGTLLYCAPEVFPDYDGKVPKGTKRSRGSKQKFHSYSTSVDIWSFAAVIWFSLCGSPPFEGISDATGRAMYENIMSSGLDTRPLRKVGVSDSCIDLLCKMLQKDPALRPTDRQCLNHPWLRDGAMIPESPLLQSIVEEDETEDPGERLSQLSLHEDFLGDEEEETSEILEDEEFDLLVNDRAPKRIRTDPRPPRNQVRDVANESADQSFHSILAENNVEEESFQVMAKTAGRPRLFGEIGKSALQLTSFLNAHANESPSPESPNSQSLPEDAQCGAQTSQQTPTAVRVRPQLNGAFSSPSLLGAESMVRELNMESPQYPISGAHSPNESATPRTPPMTQPESVEDRSQHPSQVSDATPKAKHPALSRQISLPKTAALFYDPFDPNTHTLEYASKISGIDFSVAEAARASEAALPDTIRISGSESEHDVSEDPSEDVESATSHVFPSLPAQLDINPPPRRLGKLVATKDSFAPNLTVMIDQSRTSWGRHPENTVIYDNARDTRVPKRAFVIFWYTLDAQSSTVKELSQKGKDWTSLNGLQAGIFTCATSGISINGKHLRQKDEKGRALYGHLHTGDVVQVYHRDSEYLKFRCEFSLGSAKVPRPENESFSILLGSKLPN